MPGWLERLMSSWTETPHDTRGQRPQKAVNEEPQPKRPETIEEGLDRQAREVTEEREKDRKIINGLTIEARNKTRDPQFWEGIDGGPHSDLLAVREFSNMMRRGSYPPLEYALRDHERIYVLYLQKMSGKWELACGQVINKDIINKNPDWQRWLDSTLESSRDAYRYSVQEIVGYYILTFKY